MIQTMILKKKEERVIVTAVLKPSRQVRWSSLVMTLPQGHPHQMQSRKLCILVLRLEVVVDGMV
ncbi:hypothetical protein E2C01_087810 [Portunus trituberculatus]|uniref:Uncharacterized protein n=1 Tax=Portunus trituberculatus TaxID=210409 RepID=A0A5B7JDH8_PORTR|nr:hypothetical protein [Portunus trituberculatus]